MCPSPKLEAVRSGQILPVLMSSPLMAKLKSPTVAVNGMPLPVSESDVQVLCNAVPNATVFSRTARADIVCHEIDELVLDCGEPRTQAMLVRVAEFLIHDDVIKVSSPGGELNLN